MWSSELYKAVRVRIESYHERDEREDSIFPLFICFSFVMNLAIDPVMRIYGKRGHIILIRTHGIIFLT